MTNYDFSTLSPIDFEKLACDLMNAYFDKKKPGERFKTFKPGRDKGIDILLSTSQKDYDVIGQVKHYAKSKFANLKSDLKKTEKDKVFKLEPNSYLVITSLELNIQNKLEIKEIFAPYILSLDHIFGKDDLNAILSNNKTIEENHHKLWFSSTIILNKILNYRFQGRRNEFSKKNLKRKFRLFVVTEDYYKSKAILSNNNFIILTGEPGIGKSTLSEMIIYDYIKNDYQLNVIYDDIKEIEETLLNDDSKQLFYFDDFLGHTQEEIKKSKSAETSLIKIISRIEDLDNKYLILNTRKFILNSFMDSSERLRSFNPLRSENKIELSTYSYSTKRKILDNHIYESELNKDQKQVIKTLAHKICTNNNFTPRIIEFFTNSDRVNLTTDDLKVFIINNLKDPKEIWNHAYMKQISDYDRFLLNTLYSLSGEAIIDHLKEAYLERLNFEVKNNNYRKPQEPFSDSLKLMNDSFIVVSDSSPKYINFINPSLEDFLKHRINDNIQEIERILLSAKYIEQWYFFFKPYTTPKSDLTNNLSSCFLNNYNHLTLNHKDDNLNKFSISIFLHYFIDNSLEINLTMLKSIDDWSFLNKNENIFFYSKKFIQNAKTDTKLNYAICNLDSTFFYTILTNENKLDNLIDLLRLFIRHYNLDFKYIFNKGNQHKAFINHIKDVFREHIELKYEYLKKYNTENDSDREIINEIKEYLKFIKNQISVKFYIDYNFLTTQDWNHISSINLIKVLKEGAHDYDKIADESVISDYDTYQNVDDISLDDIIYNYYKKQAQIPLQDTSSNDIKNLPF